MSDQPDTKRRALLGGALLLGAAALIQPVGGVAHAEDAPDDKKEGKKKGKKKDGDAKKDG